MSATPGRSQDEHRDDRQDEGTGADGLVGDGGLEQEGETDQLVGKVKDGAEKMIDTAKSVVKGR